MPHVGEYFRPRGQSGMLRNLTYPLDLLFFSVITQGVSYSSYPYRCFNRESCAHLKASVLDHMADVGLIHIRGLVSDKCLAGGVPDLRCSKMEPMQSCAATTGATLPAMTSAAVKVCQAIRFNFQALVQL